MYGSGVQTESKLRKSVLAKSKLTCEKGNKPRTYRATLQASVPVRKREVSRHILPSSLDAPAPQVVP